MTLDSPAAIASRRIFIPHQPEPMRAVRYFLSFDCAPMIGIGKRVAAAEAARKSRRLVFIVGSRFWHSKCRFVKISICAPSSLIENRAIDLELMVVPSAL